MTVAPHNVGGKAEHITRRIYAGISPPPTPGCCFGRGLHSRTGCLPLHAVKRSIRKLISPNLLIANLHELLQRAVGPTIELEIVVVPDLGSALDGGRLTIETAGARLNDHDPRARDMDPGQYIVIGVTDTGTAIPSDVLTHVFEPFFTTKPAGRGTGLGLSMIYGFAKQSGGQVLIDSREGVGTTVRI